MYVSMRTILDDANRHYYGVIAANAINLETVRGTIKAAEKRKSPIIINVGQGQMTKHGDGEIICSMIKILAGRASIPIALNLDHGKDYERITYAFRHGFSSIMIDASCYPIEDNIKITQEIVKLCHSQNVTVEAELGMVGQADQGDNAKTDLYTQVDDALYFFEKTQVDALAIAVGTAHGKYPADFKPRIDFERLTQIKRATNMPLVLHGGSDSGADNIRKAVQCGINKINVCTDTFTYCRETLRNTLKDKPNIDYLTLMMTMENAVIDVIGRYIDMAGSSNMANHFH